MRTSNTHNYLYRSMIEGAHPVLQALLGTLFTWGVTAAGAAVVFAFPDKMSLKLQRQILDASLGFAGGVMLAASYWSLLAPSIEFAQESPTYGEAYAFVPAAVGTALGAAFVGIAGNFFPESDPALLLAAGMDKDHRKSTRRIMLLVIAIVIHNFPEGLAVGVGFGSVGLSPAFTFQSAFNLAVGIGLQNFPEGLAVSMPLIRLGYSKKRAFMYGQLSGMVEPFAGVLGAAAVVYVRPVLPYALAFAAGAMIYVVVDDLVPEAHAKGNSTLASVGVIVGFIVMMTMDVALG